MIDKTAKKIAEKLKTDIDGIVPGLEKLKREIQKQKNEIKKLEERV